VGGDLQERGGGGWFGIKNHGGLHRFESGARWHGADPAEYRWSSYGEAMGATGKGGAKAKAGLVRAIMADKGWEADARHWAGRVSKEYRMLLLEEGEEKTREVVNENGERVVEVVKKGMKTPKVVSEMDRLAAGRDVALRQMLRWKIRYFTDSGVVGSRAFVEGMFEQCRDRFGPSARVAQERCGGKRRALLISYGPSAQSWLDHSTNRHHTM
jgi:putative transposase